MTLLPTWYCAFKGDFALPGIESKVVQYLRRTAGCGCDSVSSLADIRNRTHCVKVGCIDLRPSVWIHHVLYWLHPIVHKVVRDAYWRLLVYVQCSVEAVQDCTGIQG